MQDLESLLSYGSVVVRKGGLGVGNRSALQNVLSTRQRKKAYVATRLLVVLQQRYSVAVYDVVHTLPKRKMELKIGA